MPEFERRTGAKVSAVSGLTMQNLAKMRASAGDPQLDVVGMDAPGMYPASREGLLMRLDPAKVPNMNDLVPWAVPPTGDFVANNYGYQMLAYNTKAVKSAPETWTDLWKPEYKGRVIIPDISTSHGMFFIALVSKMESGDYFNSDAAFKKLTALKPNILTYWTGHDQVIQLLTSGQAWLTPWTADRAIYQVSVNAPVDLCVPVREGALATPSFTGIAKGTKRPDLAQAYLNVLLDPDIQAKVAATLFQGPTNKKAALTNDIARKYLDLGGLKLLPIDWNKLLDIQSSWVDRWNREMLG
jgi:putative spermidine/putrescine transport system substrate-binding protein